MDRAISKLHNGLQLDGKEFVVGSETITVLLKDVSGNVMLAYGASLPTDGTAGYAIGAMFLDTNGGAGATFYVNEGSATVCDFNVAAGATGDITGVTAGAGMTGGGASGTVTLNIVNTDGKITVGADAINITADSLVNADINTAAAIAWSKFAASTDINTSGQVHDLTISGEVNGDVLYFDGANWVRLPATSLPAGTASTIAQSSTIEAGANDVTLSTTAQTVGDVTLTIPDFANVDDSFTFNTLASTLKNKVLDDATTKFGDTADTTKDLFFSLGGATADKTMTIISSQTVDRSLTLPDATDTLVGKATTDVLTNKTLDDATVKFGDTGDNSKDLFISLGGATADKTMTIVSSQTDDRSLTLPDATDTLVGKATTDVLTNKTIDADGTGNVISNINGDELDPIAATNGTYGIPVVIPVVNAGSADINVFAGNVPFKCRVLDVYSVATKACSGNWKLTDGTADITTTVAYGVDKSVARVTSIDDATHLLDGEPLHLINSDATDTGIVYVTVLRIA